MMKKKKLAVALALACLSFAAPAYAAESADLFADVPAGHWAYESLEVLAEDGIITGLPEGGFEGDRTIQRSEMAALVGRALSTYTHHQEQVTERGEKELERLASEFYPELTQLGVRMKKLEKYHSKTKIYGDIRLRAIGNSKNYANDTNHSKSQFEHRVRLTAESELTPNLYSTIRLNVGEDSTRARDSWHLSGTGDIDPEHHDYGSKAYFDKAYLSWYTGKYQFDLGRMDFKLGQGGIAAGVHDGIYVTYRPEKDTSISAGWASMAHNLTGTSYDDYKEEDHTPIFEAELRKKIGVMYWSLSHLRSLSTNTRNIYMPYYTYSDAGEAYAIPAKFEQWGLGFQMPLKGRWYLQAEYLRNEADGLKANYSQTAGVPDKGVDRDGWWASLSYTTLNMNCPGSFRWDLTYLDMGNWAIDSDLYQHGLWVNGGDFLGGNGEKGWGIQAQYMLAKNLDLCADYFWVKPKNSETAGFSKYRSPWQVALNYFF